LALPCQNSTSTGLTKNPPQFSGRLISEPDNSNSKVFNFSSKKSLDGITSLWFETIAPSLLPSGRESK
jgi:hypothetical protein